MPEDIEVEANQVQDSSLEVSPTSAPIPERMGTGEKIGRVALTITTLVGSYALAGALSTQRVSAQGPDGSISTEEVNTLQLDEIPPWVQDAVYVLGKNGENVAMDFPWQECPGEPVGTCVMWADWENPVPMKTNARQDGAYVYYNTRLGYVEEEGLEAGILYANVTGATIRNRPEEQKLYNRDIPPHFQHYKFFGGGEVVLIPDCLDGYYTGVEPGNCIEFHARSNGRGIGATDVLLTFQANDLTWIAGYVREGKYNELKTNTGIAGPGLVLNANKGHMPNNEGNTFLPITRQQVHSGRYTTSPKGHQNGGR